MSDGTYSLGAIARRAALDRSEATYKGHERAVKEFFAQAAKDNPDAAAARDFAEHPMVLTERQLQLREALPLMDHLIAAGYADMNGNRVVSAIVQAGIGKPDRRTREFRTPRPARPPKAPSRPVGRPRGDSAEQVARKRGYDATRYAKKHFTEN